MVWEGEGREAFPYPDFEYGLDGETTGGVIEYYQLHNDDTVRMFA